MERDFIRMRLEAPLMSFGAPAVDGRRPIQSWPAVSMLTGLLANALGTRRTNAAALQRLQGRLRWACLLEREGEVVRDFQTARLDEETSGWTTRGVVETRVGAPETLARPAIREKDMRADALVHVAIDLADSSEGEPTPRDVAEALRSPARPIFLGRKAYLPAAPVFAGWLTGESPLEALRGLGVRGRLFYSEGAGEAALATVRHRVSDMRNFALGVHAGQGWVYEVGGVR